MWYWLKIVKYNQIYNGKLVLLWDSIFEFVIKKIVGIYKGDEELGFVLVLIL